MRSSRHLLPLARTAASAGWHRLLEQRLHETCLYLLAQLARLDDPGARPAAELVCRLTAPTRAAWDPADPLERLWRLPARRPGPHGFAV